MPFEFMKQKSGDTMTAMSGMMDIEGLSALPFPRRDHLLPLLGWIPWMPAGQYASNYPPVIVEEGPSGETDPTCHPVYVAYQWLAATLKAKGEMNPDSRCLLMTSTCEGKSSSWMGMNLAYFLGQAHQRVVLVDADFNNPTVHQAFEMDEARGHGFLSALHTLTTSAMDHHESRTDWGHADWMLERLHPAQEMPGVYVMPLGTDLTQEQPGLAKSHRYRLLFSDGLTMLLQCLKQHFDWVLVDGAPFLNRGEPLVLAQKADGILVFGERRLSMQRLSKIQQLAAVNKIPIWGFVDHREK